MRILVTARYISGDSVEGGSSRYMRCLIDTLRELGHEVIETTEPGKYVTMHLDLILCSHPERFAEIRRHPARKVYISHGLIPDEHMVAGADRYVAVSEEVRRANLERGIDSVVIPQPVPVVEEVKKPGKELKRILVIRREPVMDDPFAYLAERYELRMSDLERPIEEQIAWADLCITLGRGALEAMMQGKPVLVADNRPYIGAVGDGYVTIENVAELAKHNFSGRRYRHPVTREWIDAELAKYDAAHSGVLHGWTHDNCNAPMIARKLIDPGAVLAFGVLVNDLQRLDMCFRQSEIEGKAHMIMHPTSATVGLNRLLKRMEDEGAEIGVLAHQDMHFRQGWVNQVREQIAKLPPSWVVAGIIGKDMKGNICGKLHDMRIAPQFNSSELHEFPHFASCFDECVIIVNLRKRFRFDERLEGFDLYGTMCVLQAWEQSGTAWVLDAFAEHYCMRPFTWFPDREFQERWKWLHQRFPGAPRIDSTVIGAPRDKSEAA